MQEATAETRPPEVFLKSIQVDVSDDENTARLNRLAEVDKKIKTTEAEKAGDVSKHNEQLKQLRKEQGKLLDAIETRKEVREVECYERRDDRLHKVQILRRDNDQVVDERPMTAAELQTELPFKNGAAAAPAPTDEERADDQAIEQQSAAAQGKGGGGNGAGKVTRIRASDAKRKSTERKGGGRGSKGK